MDRLFPVIGAGNGSHPFRTTKNYEDFLKRIDGFVIWIDSAIANMRAGMAQGITPPRELMLKVLPQLETQIVEDPKASMFYQPLNKFPSAIDAPTREALVKQYTQAINEKIVPAYRRLYIFMKDEYIPKCRTTHGMNALPGGQEMYRQAVRDFTTTDMTPEEIFQLGASEVNRITQGDCSATRRNKISARTGVTKVSRRRGTGRWIPRIEGGG